MSEPKRLISELCPDGVEFAKIGEFVSYEQPAKYIVRSLNYSDKYPIPVLTAGQSFILGYTDEKENIYLADKQHPVIIFDDFTGPFKWVDFPFKIKSSAMKMLKADESKVLNRYIYHLMNKINYLSDEHKRLWIRTYSRFEIPVPPLEVQSEIVRILDKFTQLKEELEKELERRKKQYEYYRDELLEFSDGVEYRTLDQCCHILDNKRKPVKKEYRNVGNYPYYGANGIQDYVSDYIFDGKFILVGEDGSVITPNGNPVVTWAEGKIWVNNHAHVITEAESVLLRYLYYIIQTVKITDYVHGNIPELTNKDFKSLKIPVPQLEVQQNIVRILDQFDTLCTDIMTGLPAEIEAVQKQYEYYRDKLLSFKRKEA